MAHLVVQCTLVVLAACRQPLEHRWKSLFAVQSKTQELAAEAGQSAASTVWHACMASIATASVSLCAPAASVAVAPVGAHSGDEQQAGGSEEEHEAELHGCRHLSSKDKLGAIEQGDFVCVEQWAGRFIGLRTYAILPPSAMSVSVRGRAAGKPANP